MIYFDNASTTFPKPDVVKNAIIEGLDKFVYNANRGTYNASLNTYNMIENTRTSIANFVKTKSNNVVFTTSATESLNMIINGLNLTSNDVVFVSPFEHNAVIRTLHLLEVKIELIPFCNESWELKVNEFNDLVVLKKPKAVIISHISNSTGYLLPYEAIFKIAKQNECLTVLDAAQSFGQYEINNKDVDFIVFAGHKSFSSVVGVAGYLNLNNINLKLYKAGGTGSDSLNLEMPSDTPEKFEPSTQNALAIYSLNAGIKYVKENDLVNKKSSLVEYLLNKFNEMENIVVYKPKNVQLKGIISFNLKGFLASEVGEILSNNFDIAVRVGYHCCPFIKKFLLLDEYQGTVRISFSSFNNYAEIDALIQALNEMSGE